MKQGIVEALELAFRGLPKWGATHTNDLYKPLTALLHQVCSSCAVPGKRKMSSNTELNVFQSKNIFDGKL